MGEGMSEAVTWILVADGFRSRVLKMNEKSKKLESVFDYDIIGNKLSDQDLVSDRKGRSGGMGSSSHQTKEPKINPHQHEKKIFAEKILAILTSSDDKNEFDRLIVVAPPETLGNLRDIFPKRIKEKIVWELNKDLTHLPLHEVLTHIDPDKLAA